jgi:hypothetical protein
MFTAPVRMTDDDVAAASTIPLGFADASDLVDPLGTRTRAFEVETKIVGPWPQPLAVVRHEVLAKAGNVYERPASPDQLG